MKLTFQTAYKSIRELPIAELPSLTVITGANGAGKTQFLQAISLGSIHVEGIPQQKAVYHNWTTFAPEDEGSIGLRVIEQERNDRWVLLDRRIGEMAPGAMQAIRTATVPKTLGMNLPQIVEGVYGADASPFSQEEKETIKSILLQFSTLAKDFNPETRILLERIEEQSGIPCIGMTRDIFYERFSLGFQLTDPFQGRVARLFTGYQRERELNDIAELRAKRGEAVRFLTQEEFLAKHGPPPWELVNRVFEVNNLDFWVEPPPTDTSVDYEPRLKHKGLCIDIKFSDLSSGERVLIAMALFLYFSEDKRQPTMMPDLLLLDEIDAPLHPSMALSLLRTLKDVVVEKYGRKVIMATHAPSTVALAPEEAIFVMDAETRTLRKATRDEGIKSLTVGVPVLSIKLENRRQVFVESNHDAGFYERIAALAQDHLLPEVSLSFIASGHSRDGGCARVKTVVRDLVNAGNGTVFGIVDWDLKNESACNTLVLGEGERYSIENYILDPVLLAALLLREKSLTKASCGLSEDEAFTDLRSFDDSRLQVVVNTLLGAVGVALENETDFTVCSYASGARVTVPTSFLKQNGHEMEERLKVQFAALRRFHREGDLKREILEKILDDLPGLLPADFVEILRTVQGG